MNREGHSRSSLPRVEQEIMKRLFIASLFIVCILKSLIGCGGQMSPVGGLSGGTNPLVGVVAMGPVVFEGGEIASPSAIGLADGRVFCAYRDVSALDGKYVIFDQTGSATTAADPNQPVFASNPFDVASNVLSSGYIVLSYGQASDGIWEVITANGGQVVGEITFEAGTTEDCSVVQANNDTVFVFYKDVADGGRGKFVRYQSNGTRLSSPNPGQPVFESGEVDYLSAIALMNGNVAVAYSDKDDSGKGKFCILDGSGNLVTAGDPNQLVFHDGDTKHIAASLAVNGNFLIAYADGDLANEGKVVVFDATGSRTSLRMPDDPVFASRNEGCSVVGLANNGYLVAYTATSGSFVILDSIGMVTKGPVQFDGAAGGTPSACLLSNGKVAVTYGRGTGNSEGRLVIVE